MDIVTVDSLVQLGFSQTEAKVYCIMVSEDKMNGYQIAKALGTSRSSVYAALENLLDKGAIFSVPGVTNEYTVVEPAQLIEKIIGHYRKNAEAARTKLEKLALKRRASNYFCNIQGKQNLMDEANAMIGSAKKEILLNSSMDIKPMLNELKEAKARGVRIIVFSWLNIDLYDLEAEFYCNDVNSTYCSEQRFGLVVDNITCLIGSNDRNEFITYARFVEMNGEEILPQEDSDFLGIKSDNRLMINMVQEHIHFDIYLNKLRIKHGGEVITPDILIHSLMETGN